MDNRKKNGKKKTRREEDKADQGVISCAIATAQGGAIGVIRVSGPEAIEITSRIFTPMGGKPLN